MLRRKKERAGLLVALPTRADELRLGLPTTMVDEFLDPIVRPDVEVPGVPRRVATGRRILDRYQLRRALPRRQFLRALVLHIRAGRVPVGMEGEDDPIVVVDEGRLDHVLHGVGFLVELPPKVRGLQWVAVLVFAVEGDLVLLGLPDPGTGDVLSGQLEAERVANRLDLLERIQTIGLGELFGDGWARLRPGSSREAGHSKSEQDDQAARHPSTLLGLSE